MIAITLFKTDDKVYIHCDNKGAILASNNPNESISDIENTYNAMHYRNYESSMSACIHYMFFQPRITIVKDLDEIKNHIAAKEPRIVSLHHISGHAYGITCLPEAISYWDNAINPRLISEKSI